MVPTRFFRAACRSYRCSQYCRRDPGSPSGARPEVSGLLEGIASALGPQPALLVLDNFEHLVQEGAPLVRLLLEQIPAVTCISNLKAAA